MKKQFPNVWIEIGLQLKKKMFQEIDFFICPINRSISKLKNYSFVCNSSFSERTFFVKNGHRVLHFESFSDQSISVTICQKV